MLVQKCVICGDRSRPSPDWLLILPNRWGDNLKILRWDDDMASRPEVHHACGIAHLRQIVVRWMNMGILPAPRAKIFSNKRKHSTFDETELAGIQLAEINMDFEGIARSLQEKTAAMIIDELIRAVEDGLQFGNSRSYPETGFLAKQA